MTRGALLPLPPVFVAVLVTLALPTAAAAQLSDVELTTVLGGLDRSTTGTDAALAGRGYDQEAGVLAGLETRLLFGRGEYVRQGLHLGASQQAGRFLGVGGFGFRSTFLDLGYTVRALLPCVSDAHTRWFAAAHAGLTGLYADAGRGRNGGVNDETFPDRLAASRASDHGALGWRLALDGAVHVGRVIFGLGLGMRYLYGLGTPHRRTVALDVALRFGVALGSGAKPRLL
ncbi:MAG: hypothetical protein ACFCGT_26970 [Sandaracinaceae bacterium]